MQCNATQRCQFPENHNFNITQGLKSYFWLKVSSRYGPNPKRGPEEVIERVVIEGEVIEGEVIEGGSY